MRYLLTCLVLAAISTPAVDVPMAYRQSNWLGNRGQGSCVIASTCTLLRWNNYINVAQYWRDSYGNGQSIESLRAKYEKDGVRYAETTTGDVAFLEWAVRTRRGANIVWMGGRHMLTMVGLDAEYGYILDNNEVDKIQRVPRERFLAEWRASGGWATTPVYSPMAPSPVY